MLSDITLIKPAAIVMENNLVEGGSSRNLKEYEKLSYLINISYKAEIITMELIYPRALGSASLRSVLYIIYTAYIILTGERRIQALVDLSMHVTRQ